MPFSTTAHDAVSRPAPSLKIISINTFELETEFFYRFPEYASGDHAAGTGYIAVIPRTTDLASVPAALWGLMSSYGRQTLPALLHDQLCEESNELAGKRKGHERVVSREEMAKAFEDRFHADNLFRHALRDEGVEWFRRWTFWGGVTMGRYGSFKLAKAIVLGVFGLLFSITFYTGLTLLIAGVVSALAWPLDWSPTSDNLHLMALGGAGIVLPFVVSLIAHGYRHLWQLLCVMIYIGIPAVLVLAVGYLAQFWTRSVPWALSSAVWFVLNLVRKDEDKRKIEKAPALKPYSLRRMSLL